MSGRRPQQQNDRLARLALEGERVRLALKNTLERADVLHKELRRTLRVADELSERLYIVAQSILRVRARE